MAYVKMSASPATAFPRIAKTETPPMDPAEKAVLFEKTVIPHLNAAYNLARWMTRNSSDAEDLVQEAYLRAFRSFESMQGTDGRGWLLAIVRNACLTWLRKRGAGPTVEFNEYVHSEADPGSSAEAVLITEAALGSLQGCVEALPVEFREVIILRELEELSYQEIAEIARVPVGTVMSRLSRARKRLQQCLAGAAR